MTTNWCKVRVLDADTYDTIEFAALAFGGIGSGRDFLVNGDCLCVHGMVAQHRRPLALRDRGFTDPRGMGSGNAALRKAGVTRRANDAAVMRVRAGRRSWLVRISFAAWCNALGVVRGPHPTEQP